MHGCHRMTVHEPSEIEHKAAVLTEFAQSGMTGVPHAAHAGVQHPTFAGWFRRERINRRSNLSVTVGVRRWRGLPFSGWNATDFARLDWFQSGGLGPQVMPMTQIRRSLTKWL